MFSKGYALWGRHLAFNNHDITKTYCLKTKAALIPPCQLFFCQMSKKRVMNIYAEHLCGTFDVAKGGGISGPFLGFFSIHYVVWCKRQKNLKSVMMSDHCSWYSTVFGWAKKIIILQCNLVTVVKFKMY